MSVERRLDDMAAAVSELWTDENETRARLAALHARVGREMLDQEEPPGKSREASPQPNYENRASQDRVKPTPDEITFLTVAEVASIMSLSKLTVYRLVHSGHLPAIRVGRSFRVPEPAVYEYLRESWEAVHVDDRAGF
jgi:excisionase family DNA binding protein